MRTLRLVVGSFCAAAALAQTARGDDAELVVAFDQQAPGLPAGAKLSFVGSPVVNGNGEVAFFARATGPGVTAADDLLVYAGPPGDLTIVAREGSSAPGSGSTFAGLTTDFVLHDNGTIGLRGSIAGASAATDGGFWFGAYDALALRAREGDAFGGVTLADGAFFSAVVVPSANASGDLVFAANLTGAVTTADDQALLYRGSGALEILAREGAAAPGVAGATFAERSPGLVFLRPRMNASGDAAFIATLAGAGIDFRNRESLWLGAPGTLAPAARGGDDASSFGAGRRFRNFDSSFALNSAGTLFFGAVVVDANGNDPRTGLFVGSGGGWQSVARQGDTAPSDPEALAFGSGMRELRLNESGDLLFEASLVNASSQIVTSLYRRLDQGSPELLARDDLPAPGLDGVVFDRPGSAFLAEDGIVVFLSSLAGEGVTVGRDDQSIWLAERDGTVRLLGRSGDALTVGQGTRAISGFVLYDHENAGDAASGGAGPIGPGGQVVVDVRFTDGSNALVFTTERFGFPDPGGGGGGGPLCTSLFECISLLAARLPDPAQAADRPSKRAAKQLLRLQKKVAKSADKTLTAKNAKKLARAYRKLAKTLGKVGTKAAKFDAKGRLGVPLPSVAAAVEAAASFVP